MIGLAVDVVPVEAQIVQGRLVDRVTGDPIRYAFVVLRNSTDSEVLRVLTDTDGTFLIEAPASGTYRLQTAIIGWRSWTSPPFNLIEGETFAYRMEVPLEAIRLDALVIEGERECEIDPESGQAVSIVWEEARKALQAITWTQDSGRLQYQAIEFNRRLHPETLRSLDGSASRRVGMSTGSPFISAPAEELSDSGYIREEDDGYRPYGPDAAVLLSQSFADDHCSAIQPHPDEPELIGLGFEPIRSRRTPDIRGVMWLDRKSARLRALEFRYDPRPWPVALRHVGGQIDFEQLPNGLWFVSEWRLRLPRLARRTRGTALGQYRVMSYVETGGYVVQLRRSDGTPLARGPASTPVSVQVDSALPSTDSYDGVLTGAVTDVLSGTPLTGAVIVLLDPSEVVRGITLADETGSFAARPPRAGSYSMRISRTGYRPTASSLIDIPPGTVIRTRVNLRESDPEDPERDPESFRSFGDVVPEFRFTRDDIERTGVETAFELALTVAGVRSVGTLNRPVLLLNEHQCAPTVYVDGSPSATSQVLHTPFLSWVSFVEISLGSDDTPPEALATDPDIAKCGTILIWSSASQ
jgi:hypothetical protein